MEETNQYRGGLLALLGDAYGKVGASRPEASGGPVYDPLALGLLGVGQSALQALMFPGQVYQGQVPMYGSDGRTSPEVIGGALNLGGLLSLGAGGIPAEANSLRAGIRTYQNVPDALMGYRKSGPQRGFSETNYPHVQDVEVTLPSRGGRDTFTDQIMGMNADHAYERAWRNWPNAVHITPVFPKK